MEKKERKEYCQRCNDYVDFNVKKVKKTIQVKDETLDVEIYECFCANCGEKIFVFEYEKMNDIAVYDAYKKRVGLLTSEEIKEIRRKRKMTQIELARFVGIGDKDITRYESGAIQNRCIDKLLKLVQDDGSFNEMVRVFEDKPASRWFDIKTIVWDFDGLLLNDVLDTKDLWNPYQKIINNFEKDKKGVMNDYGRERRKEVPIA